MLAEKMIIKADRVERLMTRLNWTPRVVATVMRLEMSDAYKLLSGDAVNYYIAKAFIVFFRAVCAAALIDFTAMEIELPEFVQRKEITEAELFTKIGYNIRKAEKEKRID